MDMDPILALISIVFGILVIVFVGLLNWIVGIFFILLGIWLVYDYMSKKNEKSAPRERMPEEEKKKL